MVIDFAIPCVFTFTSFLLYALQNLAGNGDVYYSERYFTTTTLIICSVKNASKPYLLEVTLQS